MASKKKLPPASSPQIREHQLVSMAMDLAEKQILDGTASSQVITHFLKLGSSREYVEQAIAEEKKKLLEAQVGQIESEEKTAAMYEQALAAMKEYSGNE